MVGKNKVQKHPSNAKSSNRPLKLALFILNIIMFTLLSSSWSEISVNGSLLKLYSRIRRETVLSETHKSFAISAMVKSSSNQD